jgi:hypothetical protein
MVCFQRIAASLVVSMLAVGLAGNGMAAPYKKRADAGIARRTATPERSMAANMAANGYAGYYEHILDKVPFGSQLWWHVYDSQPKGR